MASTSRSMLLDNSDSDSDLDREAKRLKYKNVNRRENRPQKYRVEWEDTPALKGWLKPVKGKLLII